MNFVFAGILSIIAYSSLVASDASTNKKNTGLWAWFFSDPKPMSQEELTGIQAKNRQLRIEITRIEKRIARLQEDSSDDESTGKPKQD
jgi:hypothetical protein